MVFKCAALSEILPEASADVEAKQSFPNQQSQIKIPVGSLNKILED